MKENRLRPNVTVEPRLPARAARRAAPDSDWSLSLRFPTRTAMLGALALLLCIGRPEPTQAAEAVPIRVTITGTAVLPAKVSLDAAGLPPITTDREILANWAAEATKRIVAAYQAQHYDYARAWFRLERDGSIRLHVDEGRVRVVFTGVSSVTSVFYRLDLFLPHSVFHGPTVTQALERLKKRHDLLNIYYRVKEPGEFESTALGTTEPLRVLNIYVVTYQHFGWGLEMGSNSTWGLLPGVSYSRKKLFWTTDSLRTKIVVAVPYRRFFFDEDPKFQWVHGATDLEYTSPRLARRYLALRVDSSLAVSRYDRRDLGLASYHFLRNTTMGSLVLFLPALQISLGGAADVIRLFRLETLPDVTPVDGAPPEATTTVRALARLWTRFEPGSDVLRHDWRRFLLLRFDVISSDSQKWLINAEVRGQLFFGVGRHRFFVRGHGLLLAGDVRFWDDMQLASDYQRVFFGNTFWIHQALQLETAYRINIWSDWLDIGVFHDLSFFGDRSRPGLHAAVANGFGPSLHFLFYDMFALDFYAGFGFAPVLGFDYTLSFNLQTIF